MKFFDTPKNPTRQNSIKDDITELLKRVDEERASKYRDLFYKYSYITPGTKLTRKDIDENWNNGFMRIRSIENCTSQELIEALLGADWQDQYK